MQIIENKLIDEKIYKETLDNGMKILIVPKPETSKKYIIWGTKFGSIDNHFIEPKTNKEIKVPDGVAHYLEHKMFEQKSGVDSLYTMMALGLNANAYTTNDHTAYLFSGIDNFYKGLDELMDYVQNPYFTDENVEKERGIIGQEIQLYDDEPFWKLYLNTMKCLYKVNGIRLDVAGTIETISHITKEILYSCYNTFYNPANMTMCISGNFKPEEIIEEVKKRLLPHEKISEIKRIYPKEGDEINQKLIKTNMDVNMPLFMIGYRVNNKKEKEILKNDKNQYSKEMTKKDIAIRIILNSIIGKCSETYQDLYNKGLLTKELNFDFEFSDEYAHVIIDGESKEVEKIYERIIKDLQNKQINQEEVERAKKVLYGDLVSEFGDVENIGRMLLTNEIKNINVMDYIDEISNIDINYVEKIRKEIFDSDKSVLSIVRKENTL